MNKRPSEAQCKSYPCELAYKMQYTRVDLLYSHEGFDPTYDPTELAEHIKTHGVLLPLVIARAESTDYRYLVIDGLKRLRALESIKADYAPCIVVDALIDTTPFKTHKAGQTLCAKQRTRLAERLVEVLEDEFPDA